MKIWSVMLGSALAEYKSIEVLNLMTTSPSNGLVETHEPTFRPQELQWLAGLQQLENNDIKFADLNIAKMVIQNSAATRVIRKYRQKFKAPRALIDYTYVFALQIIYTGTDETNALNAITNYFDNVADDDSVDFQALISEHPIEFAPAGLIHTDTCKTMKSECQDVKLTTSMCYGTHLIPFEAEDELELMKRKANVTATFTSQFEPLMVSNSALQTYNYVPSSVFTVNSITPNFPAPEVMTETATIGTEGDNFWADWEYQKTITENIYTVCADISSNFIQVYTEDVRNNDAWLTVNIPSDFEDNFDDINSVVFSEETVEYEYSCVAPACEPDAPPTTTVAPTTTPAPVSTRCEGVETYDEDLSDNGFLARLGKGLSIVKVIIGRGKDPIDYFHESYGNDIYHKVGDTVRLQCKLGFSNGGGKPMVGAVCECADDVCQFNLLNTEFVCIGDEEQSMPVWTGGNFNFVKQVYHKYIVLKARVASLLSVESWQFDRVDHEAHPEYLSVDYWKTADFTLFVYCPFDVTLGGVTGNTGKMVFPDFYPGEHSDDGFLWTFLSRAGTNLYKNPAMKCTDAEPPVCTHRSAYFKGFIDRSEDPSSQGPITYNTDFISGTDYSCETGILPGHQPTALYNLKAYFPIFKEGNFKDMIHYLRNPPSEVIEYIETL